MNKEKKENPESINPLDDVFEPIDTDGFAKEQEEARPKPLPEAIYLFEITDYVVKRSTGSDKVEAGTPFVVFKCKTIDSDPEVNGKMVQTGPFFLKGPLFRYFSGDGENLKGFVEVIRPSKEWDPKKGVRLVERNGRSSYLDDFVGSRFVAKALVDYKREGDYKSKYKLDEDGQRIPTGFNSMDRDFGYQTP